MTTIKKYSVIVFVAFTMILSGLLLLFQLSIPSTQGYSISFPQFAPGLVAVPLLLLLGDQAGLAAMLGHIHLKGLATTLILAFVLIGASALVLTLLHIPFRPWSGNLSFYGINLLFILLGCLGEEIGWRGFMLPKLQKRFSPFVSAVIVGAVWGVWHLNFSFGFWGFLFYTITVIELSILFTWLYHKSGGSVLLMGLLHFFINLFSHVLLWERFGLLLYVAQTLIFGLICCALVIRNKPMFFYKASNASSHSSKVIF